MNFKKAFCNLIAISTMALVGWGNVYGNFSDTEYVITTVATNNTDNLVPDRSDTIRALQNSEVAPKKTDRSDTLRANPGPDDKIGCTRLGPGEYGCWCEPNESRSSCGARFRAAGCKIEEGGVQAFCPTDVSRLKKPPVRQLQDIQLR